MKLETLGARLRWARQQKGWTQQELANRSGTTQDVVQKIENGKSRRPRNIEKLATVLDVSPAWLQFGMEELDTLSEDGVEIALEASKLSPEQRAIIIQTIRALQDQKSD